MIRSDVVAEIEEELDSNSNLYLDLWRSFADPTVIAAMNSSDEVEVTPDADGNYVSCLVQSNTSRRATHVDPATDIFSREDVLALPSVDGAVYGRINIVSQAIRTVAK